MKFIMGEKIEMTQIWKGENVVPVTKVKAGPCTIVQVKTLKQDGYNSVQLGYGTRKEKNIPKPQKGHFGDLGNFKYLREFRLGQNNSPRAQKEKAENEGLQRGGKIEVGIFQAGDIIKVTGVSKGKGFQGVVKRHGFHGQDKTHGTKDQVRMPGSIGSTGPQRVFKGVKMPGRMGNAGVTVSNLEIVEVDNDKGVLYIKGAIPGARNSLVLIQGEGDFDLSQMAANEEQMAANGEQIAANEENKTAEAEEQKATEEEQKATDEEQKESESKVN